MSTDSSFPSPPQELIELLLGSGRNYLDQGDGQQARRCLIHALALARDAGLRPQEIRALALLGRAQLNDGQIEEAEKSWRTCHELQVQGSAHIDASQTLCDLAEAARRRDDLPRARDLLMESLRLSSGTPPGAPRARALEDLGAMQRLLGQAEESVMTFAEALRITEAMGDRAAQARILNRLGNTYDSMGRLAEALGHQKRGLAIWESLHEPRETAKALHNLGSTLLEYGDYPAAGDCFERARAIFQELGERPMLAHVLGSLGLLNDYQGHAAQAESFLRESLAIREEIGDRIGQAKCLNNLSNVAQMVGRHEEAIEWARRSITLRTELSLLDGLAKPWLNLAQSMLELDRVGEAEAAVREVAGLAERSGSSEVRSEALLLEAAVRLKRGDAAAALKAAEQARETASREGLKRQIGQAHHLEAKAHLALGDLDAARAAALAAEAIFRDLQAHHLLATCRLTLGELFLRVGIREASAERLRRAAEAFQALGNDLLRCRSLIALAEAEWPLDRAQARRSLTQAEEAARRLGRPDLEQEIAARRRVLQEGAQGGGGAYAHAALLAEVARVVRDSPSLDAAVAKSLRSLQASLDLAFVALRFASGSTFREVARIPPVGEEPEGAGDLAERALLQRTPRIEWRQADAENAPARFLVAAPVLGAASVPLGVLLAAGAVPPQAGADLGSLPVFEALAGILGLALTGMETSEGPAEPMDEMRDSRPYEGLVGGSPAMRSLYESIRKVAASDASVMLRGESGTGKELVARAIHRLSRRRGGPFIPINCPSIPRELIEAELFGHEKGAFTGAHMTREGQIQAAHGGTLFLDEIGDMAAATQSKLLRFLQEREFQRVGGRTPIRVDVRVLAATSRDLEEEIRAGRFREDLYYRISVVPIHLPPLRERRTDIPELVHHFLAEFASRAKTEVPRIAADAMETLRRHPWPGNVRELRNVVELLFTMSPGGAITAAQIPERIRLAAEQAGPPSGDERRLAEHPLLRRGETLDARLLSVEGDLIRKALERCGWNQSEAARLLGITETRIRHRMRRYGIAREGAAGDREKRRRPRKRRGPRGQQGA